MEKQVNWTTRDGREVKITIRLIKTKEVDLDGYKDVIDLKPANYEIQITARLNGSFEGIGIDTVDARHPQYAIGVRAKIGRIGIVQANLDKINDAIAEIKASPEWQAKVEAEKEIEATNKRSVLIYLSSRGWGDYSPVTCSCDLSKSNAELLSECRTALLTANDVDLDLSDEEILKKIADARERHSVPAPKFTPVERGPGYCYSCESYCYGDCGNYQPELTNNLISRKIRKAANEQNYGITD